MIDILELKGGFRAMYVWFVKFVKKFENVCNSGIVITKTL